jgi:D-glycero-D-manno-heptose 1,7-bisphosphate phosphatase
MATQLRLVVLDRDGVINADSDDYIKSPDEWQALPGSLEAIATLCTNGFTVVVATNQSGVGRNLFDQATLQTIHAKMQAAVEAVGGELGNIYVCPHHPDAGCDCRKPQPGMLEQVQRDYGCSLSGVATIGDSTRDLAAAEQMGARPILVLTGNGKATQQTLPHPVETYPDLAAAATALCAESQP